MCLIPFFVPYHVATWGVHKVGLPPVIIHVMFGLHKSYINHVSSILDWDVPWFSTTKPSSSGYHPGSPEILRQHGPRPGEGHHLTVFTRRTRRDLDGWWSRYTYLHIYIYYIETYCIMLYMYNTTLYFILYFTISYYIILYHILLFHIISCYVYKLCPKEPCKKWSCVEKKQRSLSNCVSTPMRWLHTLIKEFTWARKRKRKSESYILMAIFQCKCTILLYIYIYIILM